MLRLALLCLLAASAHGGPSHRLLLESFHGRIIGGTDVEPGKYPSQLSLQVYNIHDCGASVISATWALTAAHCVNGRYEPTVTLVSGTTDLNVVSTRHQVIRIIVHEDYNSGDSWVNDIAVLEVAQPFELSALVQPIRLPTQDQFTATGSAAIVIGWGSTSDEGPKSKTLKEVDVQIRDQDMCNLVYSYNGENVYPTQICADVPEGGSGSCNGDSGGPLFVDGTVVGLVSWALGCAYRGYPTVYTRVASYRDWITLQTGV